MRKFYNAKRSATIINIIALTMPIIVGSSPPVTGIGGAVVTGELRAIGDADGASVTTGVGVGVGVGVVTPPVGGCVGVAVGVGLALASGGNDGVGVTEGVGVIDGATVGVGVGELIENEIVVQDSVTSAAEGVLPGTFGATGWFPS